jgi:hypothetical protein
VNVTGTMPLRGRSRELAELDALVENARAGRSGALVVSGEAGVGKTALLERTVARAASDVRVERVVASESEMELAYAALHQLCGHMMGSAGRLPAPQREALEAVFGLREASARCARTRRSPPISNGPRCGPALAVARPPRARSWSGRRG